MQNRGLDFFFFFYFKYTAKKFFFLGIGSSSYIFRSL